MQPDHNSTDEQPLKSQQGSPLPEYTPSPAVTPQQQAPVVTLAPDGFSQPAPTVVDTPEEVSLETNEVQEADEEPVRWQANEYVHHDKDAVWFIVFSLVVIGLMAVALFLIKSITFSILIPVMAAALLVFAYRPPRLLDYTLSRQGLHINDRLYSFNEFKGFRVIHDGQEYSVMLIPIKRFKPGVSVYFPEEAGEAIVDMLGARLPMQDFHLDLVDKIIRKLRL